MQLSLRASRAPHRCLVIAPCRAAGPAGGPGVAGQDRSPSFQDAEVSLRWRRRQSQNRWRECGCSVAPR
jgi:hypothetical protein